ncbi:MAG: acyloxyacyl hydrolase [Phycisphaerales bacterium]|jgi:hypothetical protein|nr:acyloxyacyl hydrolase [Phycisphaerales bacterium]
MPLIPTLLLAATTTTADPAGLLAAASPDLPSMAALVAQTAAPETEEPAVGWGTRDSWRWAIHGGYAWDVKRSENTLGLIGVEFDYFLEDNLSLDFGFNVLGVDQRGDNATGANFTLQLRWHFAAREDWSMFIEGGAGLLWTSENVPIGGSEFNFTPQAGLGMSIDAGSQRRWLIGVRWHHISNASLYDTNPGRDSIMLWTGLSFPF